MPAKPIILAALLAAAVSVGCRPAGLSPSSAAPKPVAKPYIIPPGIAGTVGEFATMIGGDELVVRGYGIVAGLGDNGSSEIPPSLHKYLLQLMSEYKVVAPSAGMPAITPELMLKDKDTAIVLVEGRMPPGAPSGTTFDVTVEALPGTQTVSLDGGMLYTCDLQLALTTSVSDLGSVKTLAHARGPIFVNSLDTATDQAKLRLGRVPGGGMVARSRPVHLELREPHYRMAALIEQQINQRFSGKSKVAVAKGAGLVELNIPKERRADYAHFLEQVMHVHLMTSAASDEQYAKQLTAAISQPTALFHDISLTWETMGRQVLPIIRPLYADSNEAVAFYALRAGLRLEDELAMEPMTRLAKRANSLFQVHAIAELGKARWSGEPVVALRPLLSEKNELVRVAAYEALLEYGPTSLIQRIRLTRDFSLDIVQTEENFAVYATRTGTCKLVLFGGGMPVHKPVFYCPPGDMVTISAREKDDKIMIYRKIPRQVAGSAEMSDPFYIAPSVFDLVRTMASPPEPDLKGNIQGLGLTYSQVVGVLNKLHDGKYISADFILQRSPEIQKIYLTGGTAGRPDTPEQERR